ncbi:MAG: universal stress protein [Deltaproteobacteria bacterium]|nr:universal stress protein [Deltaproteobacteria bacterium]
MKNLTRILAPTDLSPLSCAGVRYALELARSQGAEVIVYHVVGHEEAGPYHIGYPLEWLCSKALRLARDLLARHQALLDEYLRENFSELISEVRIRREVEVGIPYRRIVEKAAEEEAGLIVMSTHGKTGLPHIMVGSVARNVVRYAPCPVLSIRPPKQARTAAAAIA